MKCNSCGKNIPETSRVCPFCLAPTEQEDEELEVLGDDLHNLTTIGNYEINTNNNELNFGDLVNTSYDESNNTIIGEVKNKKKKKKPIIPIILIIIILIGGVVFYLFKRNNNKNNYIYFTNIVDELFDYIDNSYLKNDVKFSGRYKLHYTYDNEKNDFTGTFELDANKKIMNLMGELRITDPETGLVTNNSGIIFNVNSYLNNTVISMPKASSENILLPYDDIYNLLTNNNYNSLNVSEAIHSAINEALKNMTFSYESKVELVFNGYKDKYNKISLKLDNQGKKAFIASLYNSLITNDTFINEYKNILNMDAETLKKRLKDTTSELERKYATDDSGNYIVINCYIKDDTRIYEIDLTHNEGDKYLVQHTAGRLVVTKYINNGDVTNITITRKKELESNKDKYIYSLEGTINNKKIIVKFEFTNDNNKEISPITYEFTKNIRNMSKEELDSINNNLKILSINGDWLYKFKDIFNIKCSKKLKCNCVKKECTCTDGVYTRTCNKKDIE